MEKFEKLRKEYFRMFHEEPPYLAVVNIEDEEYLNAIKEAINNETKLTSDDLAELFYTDDKAVY